MHALSIQPGTTLVVASEHLDRKRQGFGPEYAVEFADHPSSSKYLINVQQLAEHGLRPPPQIVDQATLINDNHTSHLFDISWLPKITVALIILLMLSLATFLYVIARKNREIRHHSAAFEDQ